MVEKPAPLTKSHLQFAMHRYVNHKRKRVLDINIKEAINSADTSLANGDGGARSSEKARNYWLPPGWDR
jgi:hypothetical protein